MCRWILRNIINNPITSLDLRTLKRIGSSYGDKHKQFNERATIEVVNNQIQNRLPRAGKFYILLAHHSWDVNILLITVMLKNKFGKADLTPATRFQVKYLGCEVTGEPGVAGIEKAVGKIQDEARYEQKPCPKMYLQVGAEGVKLEEVKAKSTSKESKLISLENISYCTLNRIDATIFAFNHHKSPSVVECHAVSCESEEKAKSIALALYAAFREGHFQKLRRDRRKSFEQKNIERRASFENYERACSNTSSPATSPTQENLPDLENSAISMNSANDINHHFDSSHESLLSAEYDDQELELDKIIEDLLSIVEIEKAKIEQEAE